jgi:hypothetical protein
MQRTSVAMICREHRVERFIGRCGVTEGDGGTDAWHRLAVVETTSGAVQPF